ncbi:hypothetical protein BpHYR1_010291 [Brachionus plicatilis]|uniref:Uncharacterized protein n=1 Tax=Brachionus plicatilis TaxID=10195 RepID=A0A3M7S341_BRAPC|nr:hypothetical protein BpHYR1_010291 [Brachionus plicatilis]
MGAKVHPGQNYDLGGIKLSLFLIEIVTKFNQYLSLILIDGSKIKQLLSQDASDALRFHLHHSMYHHRCSTLDNKSQNQIKKKKEICASVTNNPILSLYYIPSDQSKKKRVKVENPFSIIHSSISFQIPQSAFFNVLYEQFVEADFEIKSIIYVQKSMLHNHILMQLVAVRPVELEAQQSQALSNP